MCLLLLAFVLGRAAADPQPTATPPPPPAPGHDIPRVDARTIRVECIDCGAKFTLEQHKEALERLVVDGLVTNKMLAELRKATYLQDTYYQFQSSAHFDNCAFTPGEDYIDELLAETDRHVAEAAVSRAANHVADADSSVRAAFFALGQALHGVQDFYAHSNYIEIERDDAVVFAALEVVPIWTPSGRETITGLIKTKGLRSGRVWWGLPKFCDETETHGELNKDTETSSRGSQRAQQWENVTLHKAAYSVAVTASISFLRYAYQRWPLLAEVGGREVVFDVFQDRRRLQ
jgi:Heterokaryon incompatibility protein Het-C